MTDHPHYDQLSQTLDDLTDLAIERYLTVFRFQKADDTRWYYPLGLSYEQVHHPHPGVWTDELAPDQGSSILPTPPQQQWHGYRNRLHHDWTPWSKLPQRAALAHDASVAYAAAKRISPLVVQGGHGIAAGNAAFADDIQRTITSLSAYKGTTMTAFNDKYTSRYHTVFARDASLLATLATFPTAEANIFDAARDDLEELLVAGKAAMAIPHGGGSIGLELALAATLTTVAAVIPGGQEVSALAGARVVDLINAAVGTASRFVPIDHHQPPANHTLKPKGTNPIDIIDAIAAGLKAINDTIKKKEGIIATQLHGFSGELHHHSSQYTFEKPTELIDDDSVRHIFEDADSDHDLRIDATQIRHVVEVDLHPLADTVDGARQDFSPLIVRPSHAWDRHELVGTGSQGSYQEWLSIGGRVENLLGDTSRQIREGANHLRIAASWIQLTDQQTDQAISTVNKRLSVDTHHVHSVA